MRFLTFEGHIWYLEFTSENFSIILFLVEALQQKLTEQNVSFSQVQHCKKNKGK
jgi:hypothetical protein